MAYDYHCCWFAWIGEKLFRREIIKRIGCEVLLHGKVVYFEIVADEKLIRERLTKPRLHSEADFRVYALVKRQDEPLNIEHLVIESQYGNIDSRLTRGLDYISDSDERG